MRNTWILAALTLATCNFSQAQEPKTWGPKIPLPNPNGYDRFVEAVRVYVHGEEGYPANPGWPKPGENLRLQRAAVARNARSLALVREGLALPVQYPVVSLDDPAQQRIHAMWRQLGRLFVEEAAVRAADGNWNGAMQSHLDAMEMGVVVSRGAGLMPFLVGGAVAGLGRLDIESVITHLNAGQCREAAKRIKAMERLRPALADIINAEKWQEIAEFRRYFFSPDWKKIGNFGGFAYIGAESAQMQKIWPQQVEDDLARVFDAVAANSRRFYALPKASLPAPGDGWSRFVSQTIFMPETRFNYEVARTRNLLLAGALELRAQKLDTGLYPEILPTRADPFGDGSSLIYWRDGSSYLLYSVGPDAKDDGGKSVETERDQYDHMTKTTTKIMDKKLVRPDSKGDILAPNF